jgi:hypothetical protein
LERFGSVTHEVQRTKAQIRRQKNAERMRDAVTLRQYVRPLLYDQLQPGVPCPGCSAPVIDTVPFDFPGTMYLKGEDKTRYEAEQTRYAEAHGECHSVGWRMGNSLTRHCSRCCPRAPLSPKQVEEMRTLAQLQRKTPDRELTRWRLELFCGHVVERTAHRSYETFETALSGSTKCTECGLDPATVISGESLGAVDEAPSLPSANRVAPKPGTKAALLERVAELEAKLAHLGAGVGEQPTAQVN